MVFLLHPFAKGDVAYLEVLDSVLHPDRDLGTVKGAVLHGHAGAAIFAAAAPQPQADLVVVEDTVLDTGLDVVLEVERRLVVDLAALAEAMENAVANHQPRTRVIYLLLGVHGIFAGLLSLAKAAG